jgi:hypothetical protein
MNGGETSRMRKAGEELEPELRAALNDFRLSLDAWSQASIGRPRAASAPSRVWRRTLGWALGCLLAAGSLSGSLWQHHRHLLAEQARIAMLRRQQDEQRRLAELRAGQEEEQLLASIDNALARQVPSAMDPLAELMGEEERR